MILRWLAGQLEPDVRYPERAVNDLIKRYHPDAATLRRELIGPQTRVGVPASLKQAL